jgi:hypothetical protein
MRELRTMRDRERLDDPERELARLQTLTSKLDVMRSDSAWRMATQQATITSVAAIMVLLVAQQIVRLLTNFVASAAWSAISLGIAIVLGVVGVAAVFRRLRAKGAAHVSGGRRAGAALAVIGGFVVTVPLAWLLIANAVGDPLARGAGRPEVLTVAAKKIDRSPPFLHPTTRQRCAGKCDLPQQRGVRAAAGRSAGPAAHSPPLDWLSRRLAAGSRGGLARLRKPVAADRLGDRLLAEARDQRAAALDRVAHRR